MSNYHMNTLLYERPIPKLYYLNFAIKNFFSNNLTIIMPTQVL